MSSSSKRRRKKRLKTLGTVGLAVLALATAGVVASVALSPEAPSQVSPQIQKYYDEQVVNAPQVVVKDDVLKVGDFAAAADKLLSSKEPFTLTVVGDSTGYPKQGWVEVTAKTLSAQLGRQVDVHTWNLDAADYDPAHSYGSGEPKVTIWNGSASGRDAAYSMANLPKLIKGPSDLLVINHGHNVENPESVRNLMYAVADGRAAMAVMKQNPRSDVGAAEQEEKVKQVGEMVAGMPGVVLVDAHSAYPADPAPWLSPDGVHPSPEGYQAWADVLLARLGL